MFELTSMQMGMYMLDKMGIGQQAMLCGSVLLPHVYTEEELQHAVNEVFRINEGMRARFIVKDDKVYQDFVPFAERKFEVLRFSDKKEMDAWGQMYATIPLELDVTVEGKDLTDMPIELGDVPPALVAYVVKHRAATALKKKVNRIKDKPASCEARIVILPDACGVIIKMHHIVSDAWSMMVAAKQFIDYLGGESPKAYQYEEFLQNEEAYHATKRFQRACDFMHAQYERCPEPTWIWPFQPTNLEAKRSTVTLDRETSKLIREYAEKRETTPYMVFLTAMAVYMSRKMGRDNFYIGSMVINRSGFRERNIVGLCANIVPVLLEIDQQASFAEALALVAKTNLACFRYQKGIDMSNLTTQLYDMAVSYQTDQLGADVDADIAQYYPNQANVVKIFRIEERSKEQDFVLHFDHVLEIGDQEVTELFDVILNVMREGIDHDSTKLIDLGLSTR